MNNHFGRCFQMRPSRPHRSWRREFGTYAFNSKGRLFIHPGLVGMSRTGWLCASNDGEELLVTKKAALVPLDWVSREKPEMATELEDLKRLCESEAAKVIESEGK